MSNDVSGFGLRVILTASNTYPAGLVITQFADDTDPLDVPSVNIGDNAMGLNGDMLRWAKPNVTKITLAVIPGSENDKDLQVLGDANRVSRGKSSAQDEITLVRILPDGSQKTYTGGMITDYIPGDGVASAGRRKSKPYQFAFEQVAGA